MIIVIIFYPSIRTDVLDAQKNHLIEMVLLSTHNRFWLRKKIIFKYVVLSGRLVKPELGQTVCNTSIGKEF